MRGKEMMDRSRSRKRKEMWTEKREMSIKEQERSEEKRGKMNSRKKRRTWIMKRDQKEEVEEKRMLLGGEEVKGEESLVT